MSERPFRIAIGDLRRRSAASREVSLAASVDWRLELSSVLPEPPLFSSLKLAPMPGGVLVMGIVRATIRHTCHRCLDEFDETVEVSVSELFVDEADADGADYVIEGPEIDLEPFLRDEVLLRLPLVPSCRNGCPGVVDLMETDLNNGTSAEDNRPASPFAGLRDLLDEGH